MSAHAEILAEWGSGLSASAIPPGVRRTLSRLLLDAGGLMVAARRTDYVKAVRGTFEGEDNCTAIGHSGGHVAGDAALLSGVAIHGEDYDDTFEGTPVHVGAVLIPTILAAAERDGLSGEDALRGMAAGGELACRLAIVAPTAFHRAAFHPTAVIGAMSSAFAVSVARRLTEKQTTNALGIAGSMASGIIEYLAEGTSTKRLHPGWAAQSGLRAASLAEQGFTGPRTVFEGEHGFFRAFAHPDVERDFRKLTGGLGQAWELESLAFKPYACGTMAQPFIDAALSLRSKIPDIEAISEVFAPTSEGIVHRLWEPSAEKAAPSTPYSAKFSIPYCIAVGLTDGAAGLVQFTDDKISDRSILQIASKVRYVIDPDDPYPANYIGTLRARLEDGTEVEATQPCLRGGRGDPLTDAELHQKFRANAEFGGWSNETAERFIVFCGDAFTAPNFNDLAQFRH